LFLLIIFIYGVAAAQGVTADESALDQRVQRIAEELRCLVCQNQSLADSHADLAIDLKNQVREKLKQGASEKDVIAFMTERYGDFVLYRPPVKATTLVLWFGPG
ncbi:MAG TPA: cytochrome c-type biogenesis protein, partial [Burkholderiales bacterium]|nr:cytochrome c-type biogenesis protein [Burkholderiales bacterium]